MSAFCKSCGHDDGCAHEAKTHELKVWPVYYEAIHRGEKRFEVRKDDRGFQVGDALLLREWNVAFSLYTGRESRWIVTYILRGPAFGVEEGSVVMSIEPQLSHDIATRLTIENADLRARLDQVALERDDACGRIGLLHAERAEKAERSERKLSLLLSAAREGRDLDVAELRARLARYEAPGPALLTAEAHLSECNSVAYGGAACTCYREVRGSAYREQHARCVAVVERVIAEYESGTRTGEFQRPMLGTCVSGAREVLTALNGEAKS